MRLCWLSRSNSSWARPVACPCSPVLGGSRRCALRGRPSRVDCAALYGLCVHCPAGRLPGRQAAVQHCHPAVAPCSPPTRFSASDEVRHRMQGQSVTSTNCPNPVPAPHSAAPNARWPPRKMQLLHPLKNGAHILHASLACPSTRLCPLRPAPCSLVVAQHLPSPPRPGGAEYSGAVVDHNCVLVANAQGIRRRRKPRLGGQHVRQACAAGWGWPGIGGASERPNGEIVCEGIGLVLAVGLAESRAA